MRTTFTFLTMLFAAAVMHAAQPVAPAPQTTVRGVVTSIAGPKITLLKGLVIDVSAARITKRNTPAPDAVVAGSRVRVTITGRAANGALIADSVIVESPDASITGSIDAVSATSVTVAGQQFALSSDTVYGGFASGTVVGGASDLKAGMPVLVEIDATAAGLAAARVTAIGPPPPAPPTPQAAQTTLTGAVAAVGSDSWTVGSTKVYVSQKTTITGNPAVGDNVVVTGIPTPEHAVIAATIAKQ